MLKRNLLFALIAAVAVMGMAASANAAITDGLTAYWPLEGNLEDQRGFYHGESSEEIDGSDPLNFVPGKFGESVRLDGETQSIYINGGSGGNDPTIESPNPADVDLDGNLITIEDKFDFFFDADNENSGSFAVSTWFTVDEFDTSWQCLVCKGEGSGWRLHRRGTEASNELAFTGGTGGDGPVNGIGVEFNDGDNLVWNHVVAQTNGALIHAGEEGECDIDAVNAGTEECLQAKQVWLNGQLITATAGNMLENRGNLMQIGDNPDSPNREWEGHIDDVAVWDRALTADEIAAIYNGGDGTPIIGLIFSPEGARGDFNGDGTVDLADFMIMATNFNTKGFEDAAAGYALGDFDVSGSINLADFQKFRDVLNAAGGAQAASVPEPACCLLLWLGGLAVSRVMRRRRR